MRIRCSTGKEHREAGWECVRGTNSAFMAGIDYKAHVNRLRASVSHNQTKYIAVFIALLVLLTIIVIVFAAVAALLLTLSGDPTWLYIINPNTWVSTFIFVLIDPPITSVYGTLCLASDALFVCCSRPLPTAHSHVVGALFLDYSLCCWFLFCCGYHWIQL